MLVTEDKISASWSFLRRQPHPSIVRLVELRVAQKVEAMRDLIDRHEDDVRKGVIIVVTGTRVRIRSAGSREENDG